MVGCLDSFESSMIFSSTESFEQSLISSNDGNLDGLPSAPVAASVRSDEDEKEEDKNIDESDSELDYQKALLMYIRKNPEVGDDFMEQACYIKSPEKRVKRIFGEGSDYLSQDFSDNLQPTVLFD